jgi:membrane protein implicated in regulation of membrane protease activity
MPVLVALLFGFLWAIIFLMVAHHEVVWKPDKRWSLSRVGLALGLGLVALALLSFLALYIIDKRIERQMVEAERGWARTDTGTTLVEVPREEGEAVIKLSGEEK